MNSSGRTQSTGSVIRVLHLEDSDLDADLVRVRLENSGLQFELDRVTDRSTFLDHLTTRDYDVLLSDYQVPQFGGLEALELARTHRPQIPFLFVSGMMGEELAIETLRRGATDYVLKDRLARLPTAIQRALTESRSRIEKERAEAERRRIEQRLHFTLSASRMGTWEFDVPSQTLVCSDVCKANYGRTADEIFSYKDLARSIVEEDQGRWRNHIDEALREAADFEVEYRVRWPDGSVHWVLVRGSCSRDTDGKVVAMSGVSLDITDRKRAETELSRLLADEKRHAALLERVAKASRSINEVLSAESIARITSQQAQLILGARVSGATFFIDENCEHQIRLAATSDPGEPEPSPQELAIHADLSAQVCHSKRPIRIARSATGPSRLAAPLIGPGGRVLGAVQLSDKQGGDFTAEDEAVLVQLSGIAAAGIENAYLYERLREQDQRKDEFLATLAHELRNPLAPIRTGLSVLRLTKSPAETAEVREMMERQITHMVRLIDDLLDISRITRGKVELKRERVDVREIFEAALEVSRPLIEAGKHRLIVALGDETLPLDADPTRMAQVVSNLVNNAAKYTPEGGTIHLSARRDGNEAVIRVEDNGIGIAAEMLPKVFEMFAQLGGAVDRSQGGLGIGLALVSRLVKMHAGSITAESHGLGRGSAFVVRLPLAEASAHAGTRQPPPVAAAPPEAGKRILVVDDNVDGAETLAMLLKFAGHTTATAFTGKAALELAREFHPDVMFLDIGLPEMSGYDVAERLRADEKLNDVLLVALTGWGTEDDRHRARAAGFDHHLTKPMDAARVKEILAEAFLLRSGISG